MIHRSKCNFIVDFLLEEDGTTAVEYAVLIALIVIAVMGSVTFLATNTAESFGKSGDAIAGAFGN